jgi:hypothetical protein
MCHQYKVHKYIESVYVPATELGPPAPLLHASVSPSLCLVSVTFSKDLAISL